MLTSLAVVIALESVQPNELVTYVQAVGQERMCAKVQSTFTGVDGATWAWLLSTINPRFVFKAPLAELTLGCESKAPSGPTG